MSSEHSNHPQKKELSGVKQIAVEALSKTAANAVVGLLTTKPDPELVEAAVSTVENVISILKKYTESSQKADELRAQQEKASEEACLAEEKRQEHIRKLRLFLEVSNEIISGNEAIDKTKELFPEYETPKEKELRELRERAKNERNLLKEQTAKSFIYKIQVSNQGRKQDFKGVNLRAFWVAHSMPTDENGSPFFNWIKQEEFSELAQYIPIASNFERFNLSGMDLSTANLHYSNLSGVNLNSSIVDADSIFSCNLSNANLVHTAFITKDSQLINEEAKIKELLKERQIQLQGTKFKDTETNWRYLICLENRLAYPLARGIKNDEKDMPEINISFQARIFENYDPETRHR